MSEVEQLQHSADALRQAFAMFPSGVTAVCAMSDGQPHGLAASSFTSVSLEPALVSVCVALTSTTWPRLSSAPRVGVSVLSSEHSMVAKALSGKGGDKFATIDWEVTETGAVLVHGSALWLECSVYEHVRAGDHDIVVLKVESLQPYPEIAPMVFHGSKFRQLAG